MRNPRISAWILVAALSVGESDSNWYPPTECLLQRLFTFHCPIIMQNSLLILLEIHGLHLLAGLRARHRLGQAKLLRMRSNLKQSSWNSGELQNWGVGSVDKWREATHKMAFECSLDFDGSFVERGLASGIALLLVVMLLSVFVSLNIRSHDCSRWSATTMWAVIYSPAYQLICHQIVDNTCQFSYGRML